MDQLRALSVRQPWAHAIVHHGKDIENRTRRFGHRGWTLIHASMGHTTEEHERACQFAELNGLPCPPTPEELERGGIIGVARITGSVCASDERSASPWWIGPYGLVIDQAHALPFTPCKGTVTPLFWVPPAEVVMKLRHALNALSLDQVA